MQHQNYICHEEIISLKFDELIQKTIDDITGRNLKSPKTRLNGLNSIKNLISHLIPDIEDNVSLIRDLEKNTLISRLTDLKGKKLNGAELSSLNSLLQQLFNHTDAKTF